MMVLTLFLTDVQLGCIIKIKEQEPLWNQKDWFVIVRISEKTNAAWTNSITIPKAHANAISKRYFETLEKH